MFVTKTDQGVVRTPSDAQFANEFDAVVVGGGTGGATAALKLAESGASVLVVERTAAMGGMLTHSVLGYYFGSTGGLYEELDREMRAFTTKSWMPKAPGTCSPVARKIITDRRLKNAGGKVAYEALLSGVYTEGRKIVGVQYFTRGSFVDVGLKIAVDATAEGYLCDMIGHAMLGAREEDGVYQPYSNVSLTYHPQTNSVHTNNMDAGYIDPFDLEGFSEGIVSSANGPACLWPSYEGTERVLLGITPLLGVREGKKMMGVQTVTLRGWIDGERFDNPVFYAYANVDNHTKDIAFESEAQNDWAVALSLWGLNFALAIPMGALISAEYDNLLAGGRLLSADHDITAHVRMNRDIQKAGEAAAVIALEALANQCPCRDAHYGRVKAALEQTGCLSVENDVGYVDVPPDGSGLPRLPFPASAQEAEALMRSSRPGLGMLYAYRARLIPELKSWLGDACEALATNSAFVLALLGDASGADTLMRLVSERSTELTLSSRKYNALRGYSAAYLLGRLRYAPAAELLMRLLEEHNTLFRDVACFDEFMERREDYVFQFVSHAVRALVFIAEAHEPLRAGICARLRDIVLAPDFGVEVTLKMAHVPFDMTARLQGYVLRHADKMGC